MLHPLPIADKELKSVAIFWIVKELFIEFIEIQNFYCYMTRFFHIKTKDSFFKR